MKSFLETHWKEMAMMLIFVFLVLVAMHLIHHKADASARDWSENLTSQVLSGILGYGAGKAAGKAVSGESEVRGSVGKGKDDVA